MDRKRALVCSYYVPQPNLDSSSRRLHHFVRFLLDEGWDVTVGAKNPVQSRRPAKALGQLGVPVYAPIDDQLHQLIGEEPFDVAILAFWYVAEVLVNLIRETAPETRVIVDSMDLHFVRHARRAFSPSLREVGEPLGETYAWETTRELNAYGAADGVLAVSEKEADLINDLTGDPSLAFAVPDCEDLARSPVPFDERRGMLFIGNFEHPPNVDAVDFLAEQVLPQLDPALLEEHPLTIAGTGSEALVNRRTLDRAGIRVVGWVPSVIPYLERTRISLIPLLYGAGTKRKLIQSLMIGTPAVSTTIGIEGLDLRHGEHVLIADDPGAFAESISTLLAGRELWEGLAAKGRRHIVARRGPGVARTRLLDAIAVTLDRTPKRLEIPVPDYILAPPRVAPPAYQGLIRRVQRVVGRTVPGDSTVAVINRGDRDLLELGVHAAWHFPRDEQTGEYIGFHPEDSNAAIEHLETARRQGADFLVIPNIETWWLDHYEEFAAHLRSRYTMVADEENACIVFALRPPGEKVPLALPGELRETLVSSNGARPRISVVIPTRNRAELLDAALESLVSQSLPLEAFEVVVVDDGSTDQTPAVCETAARRLHLVHHPIEPSGIGAAKSAGARMSAAPIVLFFDDDDVAHADLLSEHLRAHEKYPEEEVAVLGYTAWAPSLTVTEVMRFATDVGHYLFSYDGLVEEQELDFTYFWGGRTSCKRSFIVQHGLFRPEFTFGSEDIELAYRLSKVGLKVVYWPRAIQYMNRPVTYTEFCRRCERQGISQWRFSQMHSDSTVAGWCGIREAEDRWRELAPLLEVKQARAAELERELALLGGTKEQAALRRELWSLYWWTFDACKVKGIVEGMHAGESIAAATA